MQNTLSMNGTLRYAVSVLASKLQLFFFSASLFLMVGCAGVTVTPLEPSGKAAANQVKGLRYYMPMPYLLVVQLPQAHTTESPAGSDQLLLDKGSGGGAKTNADESASSQPSSAPISDTSFLAATPQYQVKLVYLPDFSRPMAMSESTGLFGTSSMKPMLQDGWMLTSLDASADSKMAETLTALASIAGTVAGGGTGAAAKSANNSASKLLNLPLGYNEATTNSVLRPGLYSFYYNRTNGVLESLKPVVFFNSVKGTTDH